MQYSKQFIAEVKHFYPDWLELHNLAEEGNPFLGRALCDSAKTGIDNETVLSAESLEDLKQIALIQHRQCILYEIWFNEYLPKNT